MIAEEPALALDAIEGRVPLHRLAHAGDGTHDDRVEAAPDVAFPARHRRDVGPHGGVAVGLRVLRVAACELAEEARSAQRYAAAATDALLVRVALTSRFACSRRSEPAGGPVACGGQPRRLSRELEQRILAARELAKAGPLIVAGQLGLPASTVWKVLRRYGVSRLQLPAREPVRRYERARPGELLHVDIKKLGRFWTLGKRVLGSEVVTRSRRAGWQYLHLAIDDHSRLAYAELLPSESPADCVAFLRRALA